MKTSARNHFEGIVSSIRDGAINDEITLTVADGVHIVATVTRESRTELGLAPEVNAFGLVKASSIMLVTEAADVRLSARNQLAGRVTRVTTGAVNTEIVLQTPGSTEVVAVITNDSATHLGLAVGHAATAIFKASSVVIGVQEA